MTRAITLQRYRAQRVAADGTAIVRIGGARHEARIVDISRGGARLAGVPGAARDLPIVLEAAGTRIGAVIRWGRHDVCGVQFDREAPAALLRAFGGGSLATGRRTPSR